VLEHRGRGHPHLWQARVDEARVRAAVIHRGGPLSDDHFELVEEEERIVFRLLPAGEYVGSFVSGQGLQQVFPYGAEEALHRPFIATRPQPRRLDRDAHPGANAGQVLRDVDLAVADHERLRHDRRRGQAWPLPMPGVDQHRARDAVLRPDRLVKHGGGVNCLG
jgi:hypothetical protein